ncbi:GGDEF domain-containing protein [uncultured Oxalobacter sp.]|uniref:GGDEF domain-containing protein n=1 Tax=uncultured Oxalobacter sp. TaxID=337245 RepID=UPI00259949FB|nr:GGDEF domain-containing protein [uncultured Oxalobacter sp.]
MSVTDQHGNIFSIFNDLLKADYGIWLWEPYTEQLYFNSHYLTMLGYSNAEFPYNIATWKALLHPDDANNIVPMQFKIIGSAEYGESFDTRFRMKTKNGDYMWVLSRGFVVCRDEHGKAIRLAGIHIDTDTSEAIVNKLAIQHERMRFALDTARDGLWDWSPATGEVYFSPRYVEMCGYQPEEFPQRVESWIERVHPDDIEATVTKQLEFVNNPEMGDTFECVYRFLAADGSYKWILGRGKVTRRDAEGKAIRIVGLHTDITELRNTQESLAHLINHDTLTGLYSRFYFDEKSRQLKEKHYPLSIIYGDMDGLKLINDNLGHATGDTLLKTAASLILQGTRGSDIVARTGGDEFTLLLLNCSGNAANLILERIQAAIDIYNTTPDVLPVFISFGLVCANENNTSVNKLVSQADKNMMNTKLKNHPENLAIIRAWIEKRLGSEIDIADTRLAQVHSSS